jgi:aryl-alcohol dehydrogenase-like predicted oxidoreductase
MATIFTRKLGSQGMEVPAIGTGCMGLTWAYNSGAATPDAAFEQADQLFAACQKSGSNMLVTAWIYTPSKPGMPHNEEVVGRAVEKYGRDKWIIVDKIGACGRGVNHAGLWCTPARRPTLREHRGRGRN